MWNTKLSLLAVFAAALASGCVSAPVYEAHWAKQVKVEQGECPSIDGVYQNRGVAFSKESKGRLERHALSLAHFVNGGYGSESHQADDRLGTTYYEASNDDYRTVSLRLDGAKLRIEATRADGSVSQFGLPVRQQCRDSLLVVESSWGYDLFSASAVRGYYAFGRAEDGSLLAYGSVTGEALVVFWSSTAFWVKFPQAEPAPAQEQVSAATP